MPQTERKAQVMTLSEAGYRLVPMSSCDEAASAVIQAVFLAALGTDQTPLSGSSEPGLDEAPCHVMRTVTASRLKLCNRAVFR